MTHPEAVRWTDDGAAVDLLDQTRLPEAEIRLRLETAAEVADAIRTMRVRGAPAIGIAAAMGVAVELARHATLPFAEFRAKLDATAELLRATRPTGFNLSWALERMRRRAEAEVGRPPNEIAWALFEEANAILVEDRGMCRRIGEHGLDILPDGDVAVLTHCNAGALATGGMGTALAPVYAAHATGRTIMVYAGETRPLLQGSRLTAWELGRAGVDVTLIPDSVAAVLMAQGRIDLVVVGADRIAANGDVANKIGTYGLAVAARHHSIRVMVVAPVSTFDLGIADGSHIPIEDRGPYEILQCGGHLIAPGGVNTWNPVFDVTPAGLIDVIVSEKGAIQAPDRQKIKALLV